MKKFGKFLGAYLTALLVVIGMCCSFCSCESFHRGDYMSPAMEKKVDSLANIAFKQTVNPQFEDVSEIMVYRDLELDTRHIDSVYLSLPTEVLKKVATVCINRDGRTTKKELVIEYEGRRDVYDNLKDPQPPTNTAPTTTPKAKIELVTEEKTTVTEAPPTRVTRKDTVIDGKKTTIITEE